MKMSLCRPSSCSVWSLQCHCYTIIYSVTCINMQIFLSTIDMGIFPGLVLSIRFQANIPASSCEVVLYMGSVGTMGCLFKWQHDMLTTMIMNRCAYADTFGEGGVWLLSLTLLLSDFSCFFRCMPMLRYLFIYSTSRLLCDFTPIIYFNALVA